MRRTGEENDIDIFKSIDNGDVVLDIIVPLLMSVTVLTNTNNVGTPFDIYH